MSLGPIEFDNSKATFTNTVLISGTNNVASCQLGQGALTVAGGASVYKNLNVGQDICSNGNITGVDGNFDNVYTAYLSAVEGYFDSTYTEYLSAITANINTLNVDNIYGVPAYPVINISTPRSSASFVLSGTKIDIVNERPFDLYIKDCRTLLTGNTSNVSIELNAYAPNSTTIDHNNGGLLNVNTNGIHTLSQEVTAFKEGGRIELVVHVTDALESITFSASTTR
jgi:hypothetical protein